MILRFLNSVGGRKFSAVILFMLGVIIPAFILAWVGKDASGFTDSVRVAAYVVAAFLGANAIEGGIDSWKGK